MTLDARIAAAQAERVSAYERGDASAFVGALARERTLREARAKTVVFSHGDFDPHKHPRNRMGEFRDVLKLLDSVPRMTGRIQFRDAEVSKTPTGAYKVTGVDGQRVGTARKPGDVLDLLKQAVEMRRRVRGRRPRPAGKRERTQPEWEAFGAL